MNKLLIILGILFTQDSFAFVLFTPSYELSDPENTSVKVSSEGCTANGIPDSEIKSAIKSAVEFWNDVPESRLKLKYGGKSTASLSDSRIPKGEIIVGCGNLPSLNILGSTQHDRPNGSARVTMNEDVYTGSYNRESWVGTMTHEIGHGIGLYHSNDPASVMTYADNGWGDRPNYISQDDIDGVVYLYPNEKALGGFLGSCSSFAGEGRNNYHFIFEVILSFMSVITFSFLVKRFLIRHKD